MSSDQALLLELARRLRLAREQRGWTLSEFARHAGLSRRYLTEAEAGRANPSLLKLAAMARALRLSLRELCDLDLWPKRGERIALVGLRGAGKSSVGRELARTLEVPFVELDQRVESLAGITLPELFALHGEASYRRFELEALEQTLAGAERLVIATGGSIVTSQAAYERLRGACRTVWLQARPEEHLQRVLLQGDHRPMLGRPRALEELRALLAERSALYAQCELAVDSSGRSPAEIAAEICQRLDPEQTLRQLPHGERT